MPQLRFKSFHQQNQYFYFQKDLSHEKVFKSGFLHQILENIKLVTPYHIAQVTSSLSFIISSVLAFLIILFLISCCFCKQILFTCIKTAFQIFLSFLTYIFSKIYDGLQYLVNSILQSYRARQNGALPIPLDETLTITLPQTENLGQQQIENSIQNLPSPVFNQASTSSILKSIQFQERKPSAPVVYTGNRTPVHNAIFRK